MVRSNVKQRVRRTSDASRVQKEKEVEEEYAMTEPSNHTSSHMYEKDRPRSKYTSGLQLFRRNFYCQQKDSAGKGEGTLSNRDLLQAWNSLPAEELARYRREAKRERDQARDVEGPRISNKPIFQTRCSPRYFMKGVEHLNEFQKGVVREMGFGSLLGMRCDVLPRELCDELVKRFNPHTCCLNIRGDVVAITVEDVGTLMGIPCKGFDVPSENPDVDDVKATFSDKSLKFMEDVFAKGDGGVEFKRAFLLYALGTFLCPTTNCRLSSKHFHAVVDVHHAAAFNWAKYVMDWLVISLKSFQSSSSDKWSQGLGGCVFFLMLFYFHRFPIGPPPSIDISPLEYWTSRLVRSRLKLEREAKEKGNGEGILGSRDDDPIAGFNARLLDEAYKTPVTRQLATSFLISMHKGLSCLDMSLEAVRDRIANDAKNSSQMPSSPKAESSSQPPPATLASSKQNGESKPSTVHATTLRTLRGSSGVPRPTSPDVLSSPPRKKPYNLRFESIGEPPEPPEHERVDCTMGLKIVELPSTNKPLRRHSIQPRRPVRPSATQKLPYVVASHVAFKRSKQVDTQFYWRIVSKPREQEEALKILVEMFGTHLTRQDCRSLAPRGWVNTEVIRMAGRVLVRDQEARDGRVRRHIFDFDFGSEVVMDLGTDYILQKKPWQLSNVHRHFLPSVIGYDIATCDMVFAPVLYRNHWFCYVLNLKDKRIDVLNSMRDKSGETYRILDIAMKKRLEEVLVAASPSITLPERGYQIVEQPVPSQSNIFDCGIYLMKYLELWDGVLMPDFAQKQVDDFRKEFLLYWIYHPHNIRREYATQIANPVDL